MEGDIETTYAVAVTGKWNLRELKLLKTDLDSIAKKVGAQWVRHVLGNTDFERWHDYQRLQFNEGTTVLDLPMHPVLAYRQYIEKGSLPACAIPALGNLVPENTVYVFDSVYPTSLVHETGHIISYRVGRSTGIAASDAMASQVNQSDAPSQYAARGGPLEDMPESWTQWIVGTSAVRQATGDRSAHLSIDRANFIQALVVDLGGVP